MDGKLSASVQGWGRYPAERTRPLSRLRERDRREGGPLPRPLSRNRETEVVSRNEDYMPHVNIDKSWSRQHWLLCTISLALLLSGCGKQPVQEVTLRPVRSVMGGLFVATIHTLIFLPARYAAWYRVSAVDTHANVSSAPATAV